MEMSQYLDQVKDYLSYSIGDNTLYDFTLAFIGFVILLSLCKFFKVFIIAKLKKLSKKTKNEFDDALVGLIEKVHPIFYYILSIYFPLKILSLGESVFAFSKAVFLIVFAYEFIKFLQGIVEYWLRSASISEGGKSKTTYYGLRLLFTIMIWATGVMLVLSNLGFNITSLVASLGIGGIAVALAAQNILADIFSSFSLYFDKPFQVGDFITLGTDSGTVKKIGLKTTRLETLQGEELIVSNQELTSARVQNFKKLKRRRGKISFGVTYDTSGAKLKKVNDIIEKIFKVIKEVELVRTHFMTFEESSLLFEVVFYVDSSEYGVFLDKQQAINLSLKEQLEKAKIEMAFPTRTVYMKKS